MQLIVISENSNETHRANRNKRNTMSVCGRTGVVFEVNQRSFDGRDCKYVVRRTKMIRVLAIYCFKSTVGAALL